MRIRFVDREEELSTLMRLAEKGSGVPIYLYGPEGCGKTRLLRELVERLKGRNGYLVAYIDALEEHDPGHAIAGTEELRRLLLDIVHGESGGPLGALLAYAAAKLLSVIDERLVRGRHIVIVVDDVAQPLGIERVEAYMKTILGILEHSLERKNPASILVVASTSEGLSLERLRRHPTWAATRLLWSLPRNGFTELAAQLEPPSQDAVEEAWRLTGGNPRVLIELATVYQWSIESWLRDTYSNYVLPVLVEAKTRGLLAEVRKLADNPDAVVTEPTPRLHEAALLLIEHNLFIYKAASTLANTPLSASQELGIGEYYAWQLPAYRLLIAHGALSQAPREKPNQPRE